MFSDLKKKTPHGVVVKLLGLGGGGCNAIIRIYESMDADILDKVACIAANTDAQHLQACPNACKIQLGPRITEGLGAGSNPEVGRAATLESRDQIEEYLEGTSILVLTATLGGGTGSGSAPIVAEVARAKGILIVAVVTLPFHFEGKRRWDNAVAGLKELEKLVDTLVVVHNQDLLSIYRQQAHNAPIEEVLYHADRVLRDIVKALMDLIYNPHKINVDYADLVVALKEGGLAIMGIGSASGENAALEAIQEALNSPLLGRDNIKGAKHVIYHATVPKETSMKAVQAAGGSLASQAPGAEIKFGLGYKTDPKDDDIQMIVIASGFEDNPSRLERGQNSQKKEKKYSQRKYSGTPKKNPPPPKVNVFSPQASLPSESTETNLANCQEEQVQDAQPPVKKRYFSNNIDYEKNSSFTERVPAALRREEDPSGV